MWFTRWHNYTGSPANENGGVVSQQNLARFCVSRHRISTLQRREECALWAGRALDVHRISITMILISFHGCIFSSRYLIISSLIKGWILHEAHSVFVRFDSIYLYKNTFTVVMSCYKQSWMNFYWKWCWLWPHRMVTLTVTPSADQPHELIFSQNTNDPVRCATKQQTALQITNLHCNKPQVSGQKSNQFRFLVALQYQNRPNLALCKC